MKLLNSRHSKILNFVFTFLYFMFSQSHKILSCFSKVGHDKLKHVWWKSRQLLSVVSLLFCVGETTCLRLEFQGNGGFLEGKDEWKSTNELTTPLTTPESKYFCRVAFVCVEKSLIWNYQGAKNPKAWIFLEFFKFKIEL